MPKGSWQIVAIAVLGLALALALGAFAHTIARDTVALPATTLSSAGEALAPAQASGARPAAGQAATAKKKPATRTTLTTSTGTTTVRTTDTPTTEDWADGQRSDYDWEYLRWRCPCAHCSGEGEFPGALEGRTSLRPDETEMIDVENIEVVTPHYRGAHAAAKVRSGFTRYRASGARLGGLRTTGRSGRGVDPRLAEELLS